MRVCHVTPGPKSTWETFIAANSRLLQCHVDTLHGVWPHHEGVPTVSLDATHRAVRRGWRSVSGATWWDERDGAYLRTLRRFGSDVVLAEFGTTAVHVAGACQNGAIPLVVQFHGFDATVTDVINSNREGYRTVFDAASAILAVSQSMCRRLVALGAPPEKLIYRPSSVDTQRFQQSDPALAPPVFLAVGRFVEKKGPHLTLLAFAAALRQQQDLRLRMAGDGPLLAFCRQLAAGLGIGRSVDFLGRLDHDSVRREMECARAFVQHSIIASNGDAEGTPVAVMEAGASGLPVVSTRHEGIPEIVVPGETGLLVDEHDVQGMAEAMVTLAVHPDVAHRMGLAGRVRVKALCSEEVSGQTLRSAIQAAASS